MPDTLQRLQSRALDAKEDHWRAVVERDSNARDRFVYAVKTTGIYCRPACPSRQPNRENVVFFSRSRDAQKAGFRACQRCRPDNAPSAVRGVAADLDWNALARDLDDLGFATTGRILSDDQADALRESYDRDELFRSRVVMKRHGFGEGEYKYFRYPLPDLLADLRHSVYPQLVPIANRWAGRMGLDHSYPETLDAMLANCHAAGQTRPTPLLLKYGAGDYNCLHQDLYGPRVFPIQLAILLSEPGRDFKGGEFVLTEQRPRMQSKAEVVPLRKGHGVLFAVSQRPKEGTRGTYRVNQRHGVSRIRSGSRYTLGIIFHDAD